MNEENHSSSNEETTMHANVSDDGRINVYKAGSPNHGANTFTSRNLQTAFNDAVAADEVPHATDNGRTILTFDDAPSHPDPTKLITRTSLKNSDVLTEFRPSGTVIVWAGMTHVEAILIGRRIVHMPVFPAEIVPHAVPPEKLPDPTKHDVPYAEITETLHDLFWNDINENLEDPFLDLDDPFLHHEIGEFVKGSAEDLERGVREALVAGLPDDAWPVDVEIVQDDFVMVAPKGDMTGAVEFPHGCAAEKIHSDPAFRRETLFTDHAALERLDRAVTENAFQFLSMEYNDGARDRRSGYSETEHPYRFSLEAPSAHEIARTLRRLNGTASTTPP